jgi:hypothetical protein
VGLDDSLGYASVQVALIGIIVTIDRLAPYLAPNPIVFLFIVGAAAWVER